MMMHVLDRGSADPRAQVSPQGRQPPPAYHFPPPAAPAAAATGPPPAAGEALFRFIPELAHFSLEPAQEEPLLLQRIELHDQRELFVGPRPGAEPRSTEWIVVPYMRKHKTSVSVGGTEAKIGKKSGKDLLQAIIRRVPPGGSFSGTFTRLLTIT